MEYKNLRLVAAKAIIRNNAGDILVLQQSDEAAVSNAGQWLMPGGIVEPHETVQQAVIRETKEETGLTVRVLRLLDVGEWEANIRGTHFLFVGLFYECQAFEDDVSIDPAESMSYRWISLKDLPTIKLVEPARTIIERVLKKIITDAAAKSAPQRA